MWKLGLKLVWKIMKTRNPWRGPRGATRPTTGATGLRPVYRIPVLPVLYCTPLDFTDVTTAAVQWSAAPKNLSVLSKNACMGLRRTSTTGRGLRPQLQYSCSCYNRQPNLSQVLISEASATQQSWKKQKSRMICHDDEALRREFTPECPRFHSIPGIPSLLCTSFQPKPRELDSDSAADLVESWTEHEFSKSKKLQRTSKKSPCVGGVVIQMLKPVSCPSLQTLNRCA